MFVEIDFESEEALYMQLRNQIILGIANSLLREGDALPPVRQMAGEIGINMHTVNKAYALLREEGYVTIDRRKGAVISTGVCSREQTDRLCGQMRILLAEALCQNMSRSRIHEVVDCLLDDLEKNES